ncbi:MAG: hypothetical protein ACRDL2_11830 [Gaiellaceae bacterium]
MPTAETADTAVVFHGVAVELAGDPELVRTTARRFLDVPEGGEAATGTVRLELLEAGEDGGGVAGGMRCVYDWGGVRAWYDARQDVFVPDYRGIGRAVVRPAAGTAAITVVTSAERSKAATRFLVTLSMGELLKRRGLYFLHAAGVTVGDRAILLAGPSGSGKSTLAAALAVCGHGLLGDDSLFLVDRGQVEVLAFPDAVGLDERSAELISRAFPTWSPAADVQAALPSELGFAIAGPAATPAAIVFPVIGSGPTTAEPLSSGHALLRLAPDVLLTERHAAQAHLDVLGDLVRDLPAYQLELGPDLEAAVETVVRLAAGA